MSRRQAVQDLIKHRDLRRCPCEPVTLIHDDGIPYVFVSGKIQLAKRLSCREGHMAADHHLPGCDLSQDALWEVLCCTLIRLIQKVLSMRDP